MEKEIYEKANNIMQKINVTEKIIRMLKSGAKPIVKITAIKGTTRDKLLKIETEETLKIEREDVPIYIEMLKRWREEQEKEFEEVQEKSPMVAPYEEYYNGGLSIICPYCDTQMAIPDCESIAAMRCPECEKNINIIWGGQEKEQ